MLNIPGILEGDHHDSKTHNVNGFSAIYLKEILNDQDNFNLINKQFLKYQDINRSIARWNPNQYTRLANYDTIPQLRTALQNLDMNDIGTNYIVISVQD